MLNQPSSIQKLCWIMSKLRDPKTGCPWDIKQDYESIVPFTIEEVYEVVESIENKDYNGLKGELGDLLFQVVFYAQIASEENRFDFNDVIDEISNKLIRRHPHVFDDKVYVDEEAINVAWEKQKHKERLSKDNSKNSVLDDIPKVLPELKKAQKIQKRAAKVGFDWNNVEQVWDKIAEESEEVKEAALNNDLAHIEEEIGDLLFAVVNLSRHYKVDADAALRKANKKFESRFRQVESLADHKVSSYSLSELEEFWQQAKKRD